MRFCGSTSAVNRAMPNSWRDRGQVLEQHRADALALEVVADVEGDLGAARVDAVVAADADDVLAHRRDEGDPVGVVDVGEPQHVGVAQPAQRREEAQVDRLVGLGGVEAVDAVDRRTGGSAGRGRRCRRAGRRRPPTPRGTRAGAARPPWRPSCHPRRIAGPRTGTLGPWSFATPSCTAAWCAASTPTAAVDPEVVRDLVGLAVRAPSAGFSQGWDFVALLDPRRPGGLLVGDRRRHAPRTPGAAGVGRPRPRALPVRPRRLPRPLRPARQGLDRPVDRPLAGALLGHRRRHGGDGHAARRRGRRPGRAVLRRARSSGTTPSARRSASPTAAGSSASSPSAREAERVSGLAAHPPTPRRSTRCSTSGGSARRREGTGSARL